MKELQIFNNDIFGEVRGLNIDGNIFKERKGEKKYERVTNF
nr:MAG TPA: hypothetical protein [Caudoviricetes sp.]